MDLSFNPCKPSALLRDWWNNHSESDERMTVVSMADPSIPDVWDLKWDELKFSLQAAIREQVTNGNL